MTDEKPHLDDKIEGIGLSVRELQKIDEALRRGVRDGLVPLKELVVNMESFALVASKWYQQFLDRGLIQTPLQRFIEYNVTNGRGYRERTGFLFGMNGVISEEDARESLLMDKEKVYDSFRREYWPPRRQK